MRTGDAAMVVIAVRDSTAAPRPLAASRTAVKGAIQLTRTMKATLVAEGFTIHAESDSIQLIVPGEITSWIYSVTPLASGTRTMTGIVAQRVDSGGGQVFSRSLDPVELKVVVHINPAFIARVWYDEHQSELWKWIFGGGLGSIAGVFGLRQYKRRAKRVSARNTPRHGGHL